MNAGTGFPIDLVLFGMVAAFLVLRLRSILGRRTGFERPPQSYQPVQPNLNAPVIDAQAEAVPTRPSRAVPDPATPLGQSLARMQAVDHNFSAAGFLDGAEKAFAMIVGGFASGDRVALRALLSDDTYRAFETAIAGREAAGQTQTSDLRGIQSAVIESADLRNTVAQISVRFVSDQVSVTRDKDGKEVSGADAVMELTDLWTFERDLSAADPTWRLMAARSA
jgi:predicted lipid-binding transport protein (Tim44 family)